MIVTAEDFSDLGVVALVDCAAILHAIDDQVALESLNSIMVPLASMHMQCASVD